MNTIQAKVLDLLERALWSGGEQLFAALFVTTVAVTSVFGLPWKYALVTAAGAFVASVLLSIVQFAVTGVLPFWADLAVRAVKTFAASLAGAGLAGPFDILTVHWSVILNAALLATLIAVGKAVLASHNPLPGSTLSAKHAAARIAA